jgi:hypothetical protein
MDSSVKIVTRLPLRELWRDDGFTTSERGQSLTAEDITTLLQLGSVQFVVAEVGVSLRWIQPSECYRFWKTEVETHLAAANSGASLDEFPGEYCYFASRWNDPGGTAPIIVFEKHH